MASVRPFSPDTSAEVQQLLVERWRAMEPWQKAELVTALSLDCRRLALAGIRSQEPGASPARERFLLAERQFGSELAREVYGSPDAESR